MMNVLFSSSSSSENDDDDEAENQNIRIRCRRTFRPRINFDLRAVDARQRFRLTEEHIDRLNDEIGHVLQHKTARNFALTPNQQIRLSLRYLATGDSYKSVSDAQGVDRSTLSRTLHRFVDTVSTNLYPRLVDWPATFAGNQSIVDDFYELANFPSVVGCVDGTHIKIIAPSRNEQQFVNRHKDHSLNCMLVCGPNLKFLYCSSKWPGCLNDQRVLRRSNLLQRLRTGWRPFPRGVLLGDNGYANRETLITPILDPQSAAERQFNRAHKRTRRLIECAIGVLKQRFRCLLKTMEMRPEFAAEIVRCCVALHNLYMSPEDLDVEAAVNECNNANAEADADGDDHDDDEGEDDEEVAAQRGIQRRNDIVATFA